MSEFDDLPDWLRDDLPELTEEDVKIGNDLGRYINIDDDTDNGVGYLDLVQELSEIDLSGGETTNE